MELGDYTILQYTGRDTGPIYLAYACNEPMRQGDILFVSNSKSFIDDIRNGVARFFLTHPEGEPALTAYKVIPYKV